MKLTEIPATRVHRLTAAALCLVCSLLPVNPARSEKTSPDNRFLNMELSQLMDVTITSVAKKPQALAETAAAVFVITQEDICRSGVTSIPAALAMAPGIQVAQISASKWSVSSRGFAGFTSNKLLILIDGRSVYSPAYSGTFWDMQNTLLEDIERIEVIRGPGGTVWGANAVNGVINIITKKAQDTEGTLLRASLGSESKWTVAARQGGKISDDVSARLYLQGHEQGSNRLESRDADAFDGWQSLQTGFRADGRSGAENQWTLQGDIYKNEGDTIISPYWLMTAPFFSERYTELDNKGANLLGRWQHQLGKEEQLSLQLYYDYSSREEDFYSIGFSTFDSELQYENRLAQIHAVTLGAGYRRIEGDNEPTTHTQLPDTGTNLFNIFAQDAISLLDDRLILTLGMKWEHNDYTGGEWQPSGKLLWKAAEGHSLWTSVARAVRTPSVFEDSGHLLLMVQPLPDGRGMPIFLNGNDAFDIEEALAYEAGYRWQVNRRLSMDVALFYTDYDQLYTVSPVYSPSGISMTVINARNGYNYGLEAAISWKPRSGLSLTATYAFLDAEYSLDTTRQSIGNSLIAEESAPQHQLGLRGSFDFAENWQLNGWLRWVDRIEGRNIADLMQSVKEIEAAFLLDLNVIWKIRKNLEFMLAGQNLLDDRRLQYYVEYYSPAVEIERGVFAKLTWKF